ncbi:ABC-2 family transporter protein [Candidatus Gugararchaeum adminiculabundum]|nr:ABC-2 family transporter protein [Candidatus Gugararchaeum adminiculabundum]
MANEATEAKKGGFHASHSHGERLSNGNGSVEKFLDFKKVWAIVRKNWMVLKSDKARLAMLMIFPLIMIVVFGSTSGEAPKHIPAAIVDYDNSPMSHMVITDLYSNQLFSIGHQLGSQDEGKRLIASGDIKILFIIPSGFGDDLAAGRSATLSIIVDESDPTVAQITRASTQGFIQQLSTQLSFERVAAISARAERAQGELSTASSIIQDTIDQSDAPSFEAMQGSFRNARSISSSTGAGLSQIILGLQNSVGYVINPIETASLPPTYGPQSALFELLGMSDTQDAAFQQIASYQGLQGANDVLFRDAASIYASANTIYANSLANKAALSVSLKAIDSATGELSDINSDVQAASSPALTLNEIKPYGNGRQGIDFLIPSIIALAAFQGAVMGMGRAIAGERRDGSLTRVFLTPTSNVTIISGTLLFYILLETIRSLILVVSAVLLFGVVISGSLLNIAIIVAIYAAGSTGIGMVLSVMSKSQDQYQAFAMLISLPSMFLSGVFLPVETMPAAFQAVTKVLPITYASDALRGVIVKGFELNMFIPDLIFLAGFFLLTLSLSVLVFKRELV